MHIRFSQAIGLPVASDDTGEQAGTITGILIHPDTAKVEGFFVRCGGFASGEHPFLGTQDIIRWGHRVTVRHPDVFYPVGDVIRLQSLIAEGRPVLGQKVRTVSGQALGTCKDVQFDTRHFQVEWLFPKRWWRWGMALPVTQVVEIRKEAIIMRDPAAIADEKAPLETSLMPPVPEAA